MANCIGSSSSDFHSVFIETNIETRLVLLVHNDENISDFKDKLRKEHKKCFPQDGEINVSALKVKRRGQFYHLADSMNMSKAFEGTRKDWFIYVDVVRVDKEELLTIMDVDQNCSNHELLEKKEIASDLVLVDGHTKDMDLEECLKTKGTKTKKRKMESSDGKKSRKKRTADINLSDVVTTAITYPVDESHELRGEVQLGVNAFETSPVLPREKLDDILTREIQKDIQSGEINDISMRDNQKASNADDRLSPEEIHTINSKLIDVHTSGEIKDVQADQTHKEAPEIDLAIRGAAKEQDHENGETTAELIEINQEKDLALTKDFVDGLITLRDDVNDIHEKLDCLLSGSIEKDNERGEESRMAPNTADNLQTTELVTNPENHLEGSSGLPAGPATEKKTKRKKSTKDHIDNSTTTKKSKKKTLVEERQKENEVSKKTDDGVESGKFIPSTADNVQVNNFASYPENQLEANSGLVTGPTTEKKRRQKKSAKDLSQTTPMTTNSKEIVVEKKIDDDVGSGKAIPCTEDNIQIDHFVSYPGNQLEANSSFTSGPATEKKRKQKKSSKEHRNQSTATSTISKEIVDEMEKISRSIDAVVDTRQNENETGDKFVGNVGPTENLQVADLASTLVQESKTLEQVGKFTDENHTHEPEVAKNHAEIDVDEVKSVKSTKKKKSRKAKTPAKEDTLGDSLLERNEPEENLEKIGKKSSKKSKNKHSSNIVDTQVLLAQEEAAPANNPKDTDTLFTPAKKYTENVDVGDNFGVVGVGKKQDQVTSLAKSKKEKKSRDLHPTGSIDGSLSSMKPKERKSQVKPATSGTSHLQLSIKNDRSGTKTDPSSDAIMKAKSSNSLAVNKTSKMNFFNDAEKWNSIEDETKMDSDVSTKSPSDSSSDDDDSDVTSMSRKQGNDLAIGTNRFSGSSLQDILRSSSSYKKAKLTASQSQPDIYEDESPPVDCVPDSQAN